MGELQWLSDCWNKIPAFLKEWGDIAIALAALVLSVISFVKSSKAEKLQQQVNELELIINQNEVEKIEQEKAQASVSKVEAQVFSLGRGKHGLRVSNLSDVPVYNVTAQIVEGNDVFIMDREKQPFEELSPHTKYDLIISCYDSGASKIRVGIEWYDADGSARNNTQWCDV